MQILDLIQELLPPVADINLQFAPITITAAASANHSVDSACSQSGEAGGGVTTSSHYAVVESDHPYKAATVANYRVSGWTTLWLHSGFYHFLGFELKECQRLCCLDGSHSSDFMPLRATVLWLSCLGFGLMVCGRGYLEWGFILD